MNWIRHRISLIRQHPDQGWAAMWMVISFTGLMVVAGLVLDGGQALAARGEAASAARQAARAGADAMSLESLRLHGVTLVDPEIGRRAAMDSLQAAGAVGEVTVTAGVVEVRAQVTEEAILLKIVGITEMRGTASETAVAVLGVTTEGG